jgi:tRNA (Thr-GGU) A37 N-methylase
VTENMRSAWTIHSKGHSCADRKLFNTCSWAGLNQTRHINILWMTMEMSAASIKLRTQRRGERHRNGESFIAIRAVERPLWPIPLGTST